MKWEFLLVCAFFFLLRMLNFAETVRMLIRQAQIGNILLQKEELLIQMPLPNSVGGKADSFIKYAKSETELAFYLILFYI